MKPILIISLFILSLNIQAQDLKNEIGLRGGESSGIFYRGFVEENQAIKALLTFRNEGAQMTGLYEKYMPIPFKTVDNFFFYYGVGGHVGFEQWHRRYHYENQPDVYYYRHVTAPVVGVDGMAGIEYRLKKVPLSFGFDYKPYFDLFGEKFFELRMGDFGFSFKFRF
jgi:hypothetical protein